MNDKRMKKMLIACAIITPTMAVFGSRLIGSGVAMSFAELPDEQMDTFDFPQVDLSRPATLADGGAKAASPFWIEEVVVQRAEPGISPVPGKHDPRPVESDSLPEVRVTSVLPNPRNPLAVIDGKPRRVGETLPSGWTVLSINSDSTVSLVHRSGAKIRVGLKKGP